MGERARAHKSMTEYPALVLARVGYSALEYARGRGRERKKVVHANKRKRKGNEPTSRSI